MENTQEPSCMVARDCMLTWRFSRIVRVHSPRGSHTRDKYTTGVLHMVYELRYALKLPGPCMEGRLLHIAD